MTLITEDSQVGDKFAGKPKTISWERLWAFSGGPFRLEGWPSSNIHTDPAWAEASKLLVAPYSYSHVWKYLIYFLCTLSLSPGKFSFADWPNSQGNSRAESSRGGGMRRNWRR